jgi:hypothetical protein
MKKSTALTALPCAVLMAAIGMFGGGLIYPARSAPADGIPAIGQLRIHRTWMPKAHPSAFAVGFPSGLNFCFDALRGNLIYAWEGDFVDLSPTVNGKIPRDAVIRGTIFYAADTVSGFRTGNGSSPPEIRFKGHRVKKENPEFHYEVDGVPVWETVRVAPNGAGLIRQFRVTTPDRAVTYSPAQPTTISIDSGAGTLADGQVRIPGNSTVVFSLPISRP